MKLVIPIAHDFICPWCWVGLLQARRLQQELGVEVEWIGYELFPEGLEWLVSEPAPPPPPNKPAVPTRFEFLLYADGISMPGVERPKGMRTFNAHQALEFAKAEGIGDRFAEILYRAYWERGAEINSIDVLISLGQGVVSDLEAFKTAIVERRFRDRVVGFDDDAHEKGVYNVPTFFIGGERFAEQPYVVLKSAVEKALSAAS